MTELELETPAAARADRRRCSSAAPAPAAQAAEVTLLNVSYDPTRELYVDFNKSFAEYWKKKTGDTVKINQSHGGSGRQARSVIDGLAADVVTLALAADIDAIANQRQTTAGELGRAPAGSFGAVHLDHRLPGSQGQSEEHQGLGRSRAPGHRRDHAESEDLGRRALELPRGLGLGEEAARRQRRDRARNSCSKLFKNVPVLDTGARGSTTTFAQRGIGDVAISWENEAWLATKELGPDKFEIVIPSISILAEPSVAVVDKVVLRRGTRTVAEEYLKYLYTPEGQEIAARNYYRPRNPQVAAKHAGAVPEARARDHQGLRRLGQGAEGTLRRRRRVRPDLCAVSMADAIVSSARGRMPRNVHPGRGGCEQDDCSTVYSTSRAWLPL